MLPKFYWAILRSDHKTSLRTRQTTPLENTLRQRSPAPPLISRFEHPPRFGTLPETMENPIPTVRRIFGAARETFQHAVRLFLVPQPPLAHCSLKFFPSSRDKKNSNAERKSATPYRRHIRTNGPILLPLKNRNE